MKKAVCLALFTGFFLAAMSQKTIRDANAEKRNVSGYHAISVSGGIDLYLSPGDESVAVSAVDTKFRDEIKTEVVDGVLKIYYHSKGVMYIRVNRKLKAYVSFKTLDKLTASGGSDIRVEGTIKTGSLAINVSGGSDFYGRVEAGDLKVSATGGSDMDITGTVGQLDLSAHGGSDFKGYGLIVDNCSLEATGGSDVYITVNKELRAVASGGSDVYYKGEGVIREIRSSGSSSIKKQSS